MTTICGACRSTRRHGPPKWTLYGLHVLRAGVCVALSEVNIVCPFLVMHADPVCTLLHA